MAVEALVIERSPSQILQEESSDAETAYRALVTFGNTVRHDGEEPRQFPLAHFCTLGVQRQAPRPKLQRDLRRVARKISRRPSEGLGGRDQGPTLLD